MPARKKSKRTSSRRKSGAKAGTRSVVVVIAAAALAVVCLKAFNYLSDNKIPNFRQDATIFVDDSTTAEQVYATIIQEAGVKRPYSLSRAFREKQVSQYLQPGRYEIRSGYTSVYVARMLNNCWQSPAKLVLSGTIRLPSQLASKISHQLMIDSLDVIKALGNRSLLSSFGFTPTNVFSLFIPDTYEMYWTSTMKDVLQCQKAAYDGFWSQERIQKAEAQGLTPGEVSILASIVNGETNYEPEMPKVAGTYLNRLHRGMKLQADPTVAFCFDYSLKRILRRHLSVDSPYNTYKYEGLPPGPICVPTKAAMDAVLNPQGDFLYFCASSDFDGTHKFARSYSEHCRYANDFHRALTERRTALN